MVLPILPYSHRPYASREVAPCLTFWFATSVYLRAPEAELSMSTKHTASKTPLILRHFAWSAAHTMGSLEKRGASRMPGTMPSLGNTCLTTSSPVSAPVAAFTPPTMSAAVILVGSRMEPETVRAVAPSPLPPLTRAMLTVPSSLKLAE